MILRFSLDPARVVPEQVLALSLRLCYQPHPHLVRLVRAYLDCDQLCLELEPLRAIPLGEYLQTVTPEATNWARWARQLASLGSFLEKLGFPLSAASFQAEQFFVCSSGLVLADPGLAQLAEQGEAARDLPGALRAYGSMLRQLAGDELPADLVWIVSRCLQSGQDTGYPNFEQLELALEAALTVLASQEAPSRPGLRSSLKGFTLPFLASVPRFPWDRLLLGLCLVGTLFLMVWQWWSAALPPRHYPAAVVVREQELWILDLSSPSPTPKVRRRLPLPSPLLRADWLGNSLWLVCQDRRHALVLDPASLELDESCAIDPNPADMQADPEQHHLYLLYPSQGRALVIRRPGLPLAYLTVANEAEHLLPLSSDQLVVYNEQQVWSHSLPLRTLEWQQHVASFQAMDVGDEGYLWLLRSAQLMALEPEQGNPAPTKVQPLIAPGSHLMAHGPYLVVAQPSGLELVPAASPPKVMRLGGAAEVMVADAKRSDRLWVQRGAQLIQLDLGAGSRLSNWQLPPGTRLLGVLP